MDVARLFKGSAQPPCFYNVTFDVNSVSELYDYILEVYKYGATHLFSDGVSINILTLSERRQFILKEYMMSIGIKPVIEKYLPDEIDDIYKEFISTISEIPSLNNNKLVIHGLIDGDHYVGVKLSIPKEPILLEKVIDIIENDQRYKDILDMYPKKTELSDFKLKVKINSDINEIQKGTIFVLRFYFL